MDSWALVQGRREESPNDRKLSDTPEPRGACMVGGKAAVEAGAVTHGAVRCSAWLGALVKLERLECAIWECTDCNVFEF